MVSLDLRGRQGHKRKVHIPPGPGRPGGRRFGRERSLPVEEQEEVVAGVGCRQPGSAGHSGNGILDGY